MIRVYWITFWFIGWFNFNLVDASLFYPVHNFRLACLQIYITCPFQIAFSRHRYSHAAHKSMLFKVSKCSVLYKEWKITSLRCKISVWGVLYKEWKITSLRCKISVWGAGTALLVRGHHFRRDPGGCTVSQGAALLWTPRSNVSHGAALLWTPRGLHCQPKGQRSMLFNAQSTVKVEWG